jgi:hypothetical protein
VPATVGKLDAVKTMHTQLAGLNRLFDGAHDDIPRLLAGRIARVLHRDR